MDRPGVRFGDRSGDAALLPVRPAPNVVANSLHQFIDFRQLDELLHPLDLASLPTPAPAPTAAVVYTAQVAGSLSEAEMDTLLEATGWPVEWRADAKVIAWCESRYRPGAVGDGGNSLGLFQLWYGWFPAAGYSAEQAYDPEVNSRVALYVRQVRGRFGGGGGWTCADLRGVP